MGCKAVKDTCSGSQRPLRMSTPFNAALSMTRHSIIGSNRPFMQKLKEKYHVPSGPELNDQSERKQSEQNRTKSGSKDDNSNAERYTIRDLFVTMEY